MVEEKEMSEFEREKKWLKWIRCWFLNKFRILRGIANELLSWPNNSKKRVFKNEAVKKKIHQNYSVKKPTD